MTQSKDQLDPEKVATHALVVGDTKRANDATKLLTDPVLIWEFREFKAYTGTKNGRKITICSHGVGASSAAVIFEKLFNAGVSTVIRAGTCGALVAGVPDGGLIIGTGAIRSDGLSQSMVPMEYPAISDRHVVRALEESAAELGHKNIPVGIVLTDGLYFPYPYVESRVNMWPKLGAVAIEMEFATLLVQAGIHGARAGGIFTSDGNVIEEPDPWVVNADREVVRNGIKNMLQVAIEALVKLD
jgi:uridine phosphorylase